jgi:hypothetical protein
MHGAPRPVAGWVRACLVVGILLGTAGCATQPASTPVPEDFPAFWHTFRSAALAGKIDEVATLTRFPFLEKGMVPGIESVEHTSETFRGLWPRLMRQPSGDGSSTMRALIESRATPDASDLAPSGMTAQVGMFEFEKSGAGWRFTAAFLSD